MKSVFSISKQIEKILRLQKVQWKWLENTISVMGLPRNKCNCTKWANSIAVNGPKIFKVHAQYTLLLNRESQKYPLSEKEREGLFFFFLLFSAKRRAQQTGTNFSLLTTHF